MFWGPQGSEGWNDKIVEMIMEMMMEVIMEMMMMGI